MSPIRTSTLLASLILLAGCGAAGLQHHGMQGPHGLVSVKGPHSQSDTVNRQEAEVRQRNLNVTGRIDHTAAVQRIGQPLRPNEVVIFGNPQAGTPLMQCASPVGIDLPIKAFVWTDGTGQVWLDYNDPAWLIHRHGVPECPAADNVRKALAAIAEAAVAR